MALEYRSFNDLWRAAKQAGIAGASGSTATSCLLFASDLQFALSRATGQSVCIDGGMAQSSQHPYMLAAPTLA